MRVVLMLLVLVNFGFFAWQQWHAEDAGGLAAVRSDEPLGKGLVLVGEQGGEAGPAEQAAAPAKTPAAEVAPTEQAPVEIVATTCATLGPFDERDAAEVAVVRLDGLGYSARLRESGGQIRSGFWVYLPPFDSRSAAKEVEDALKARGVRDLFIVAGSENENAISLGLFSTPERADQRAAEIGRLGFTPRVAERFRDATVYWLDFREQPGQPLEPEAVGVMGAGETLPEKREIPCSEIAQAEG